MLNCSHILIEGFLLQAHNIHLFIPVFLVAVAYTILSTYDYTTVVRPLLVEVFHQAQQLWFMGRYNPLSLWTRNANLLVQARISAGHLAAASVAYLLVTAFTVGPAVLAVTVSAAVTACSGSGDRRSPPSFHALVRNLLAGAMKTRGPFRTALLGHVVHAVACRGAILVFEVLTAFTLRYYKRDLGVEFLVFLLGHVIALYVEVVCTLAVVVSAAAEPAGGFYGVRALRQAWWIVKEKTTPAVILVFVKTVVTAVLEAVSIRVYIFPIHYYYNLTMAYAAVPVFVCTTLYAALQLWFVCATTVYYYQCRQRTDD